MTVPLKYLKTRKKAQMNDSTETYKKRYCKDHRVVGQAFGLCQEIAVKRRSGVVGAFPNKKSLIRLAVAMVIDINEERLTGRRYLDMEGNSL